VAAEKGNSRSREKETKERTGQRRRKKNRRERERERERERGRERENKLLATCLTFIGSDHHVSMPGGGPGPGNNFSCGRRDQGNCRTFRV
jgi:hypothetical protein